MKKLKTTKKPNPYVRSIVVTFKINADEMRKLIGKSHAFTKGNISEWVRFASLNFRPAREDFEK